MSIFDDAIMDCDKIIEWLEKQQWQGSSVIDAPESLRTSQTVFVPLLSFRNPTPIHEMNKRVFDFIDQYAHEWKIGFSEVEHVSVQKYEIGQFYGEHSDAAPGMPRNISALVYLNDVDEGGETFFTHFDFRVRPKRGRVVVFPSNYIYAHSALAPISGVKYAAAFWARG